MAYGVVGATCDTSNFNLLDFVVTAYPPGSKSGCNFVTGQPSGCMKPGDTVQLYVSVECIWGCFGSPCVTVTFSDNGSEIGRKDLCWSGGTPPSAHAYTMTEASMVYTIPSYGSHSFCAEIVSVVG